MYVMNEKGDVYNKTVECGIILNVVDVILIHLFLMAQTISNKIYIYNLFLLRFYKDLVVTLSTMRRIASEISTRNIGFLDAPVSGGPPGARAGTLSVLVSGSKDAFEQSRTALDMIASKVFYLGDQPGTSQIVKLINNHVSAAGRLAVLEGLAMGVKAGIDTKTLNDVLNASSGRNYTTTDKVPAAILSGTYKFNGPLSIGLKDHALLMEEARQLGARMWIAPRILETYEEAAAAGYREQAGMRLFIYMQEQSAKLAGEVS